MGHRHVSNQFMISGPDQHANNRSPEEQSCIPMARAVTTDNGPFYHSNSNEHHSTYVRMEVQRIPPPFSRPPADPYSHSSTNENTLLALMCPYNIPSTGGITGGITAGNGGPYKRKSPCISESSSSSFYCAGSSSNSQMLIEKPPVDHHGGLPPFRGSSLLIDGQDSMRNVRSRSGPVLPSYASHYYEPTTHSANYVHPVNPNADVISREWNSVPSAAAASSSHGRTPHDINVPRHEPRQFYGGGSSVDMDAYHHDSFFRRNLVSSSQHPYVPQAFSTSDGQNYPSQRVTPLYTNSPNYHNNIYPHVGSSSNNELRFPSENLSSRYSRHSGGDGGYSNRRPRIDVERLQPIVDGLGHEITTVDQSPFYRNSIIFLDQHQDMRLDIDNMSYEELLALEERIGNVNTGLSEDGMSMCLKEQVYSSADQNYEEATCPICLEEYKNGEKIGKMRKCGHEYHKDCIKKWLLMKKVCPVCKSECSTQ